jgi:hypothetical protein
VAATPQRNVAPAMYKYPRTGCALLAEDCVEPLRIEPNHYFLADHQSRRGMAAVFLRQVFDRVQIRRDVPRHERHPALRQKQLHDVAGRTIRVERTAPLSFSSCGLISSGWRKHQTNRQNSSISTVIVAVFSSIADTEQYFSLESRTASSTAFRDTLPPTR